MAGDSLLELTPAQKTAIETRGCSMLVSAAAGSGKTKVLVERIIHMLQDQQDPVDIDRLLVVTFTDAAAVEMKHRIGAAISDLQDRYPNNARLARQRLLLQRASISTLHAFASKTVRRFFYLLDVDPAFRVADENEIGLTRGDILESIIEKRLESDDAGTRLLLERYGDITSKERLASVIASVYDFSRSQKDPEAWLDSCLSDKKAAWCREVAKSALLQLSGARDAISEAKALCERDGGPGEYLDAFADDRSAIENAIGLTAHTTASEWDGMLEGFSWIPVRLPASRKSDLDLRGMAQELRKMAKKMFAAANELVGRRTWTRLDETLEGLRPELLGIVSLVREFGVEFSRYKQGAGLLDFSDLEQYCLLALTHPDVAAALREEYREVMVDECQDISPVQEAIIAGVAHSGITCDNLFMVGDVKQSIYRFRLAEPSLFMRRSDSYSTAPKTGAPGLLVNLSENFRSRPGVIDAVNYVFEELMSGGPAELEYGPDARLSTRRAPGPKPQAFIVETGDTADDEEDLAATEREARFVARKIAGLLGKHGDPPLVLEDKDGPRSARPSDFAVLLRTATGVAGIFADELRAAGVPTYADLATGYFEATEVKVLISLLQLIDNCRQDIPLAAVMRSPMFGFDAEAMAKMRLAADGQFYDAVLAASEAGGALGERCAAFLTTLAHWRTISRHKPVAFLIDDIIERTHYDLIVQCQPQGKRRMANLAALAERARQFDKMERPGLQRFLRFIERLRARGSDLGPPSAAGDAGDVARVMSIHKSKGLEFPVVFVPCLSRKWNRTDLLQDVLYHRELGLGILGCDRKARTKYRTLGHRAIAQRLKEEALAEEIRILYVAMTRAKDLLVMTSGTRDARAKLESWAAQAKTTHASLLRANSYMDLLGPLVARKQDWFDVDVIESLPAAPASVPAAEETPARTPEDDAAFELVCEQLEWEYPFEPLTTLAAKVSASEAWRYSLEGSPVAPTRSPFPRRSSAAVAASRGTATHAALERMDLGGDLDASDVERQMADMLVAGFISPEQARLIDPLMIAGFFRSEVGQLVKRHAATVDREVVFTITVPAEELYSAIRGQPGARDPVVVQGVIDCIVDTGDGYVVIDYKTDDIDREGVGDLAAHYRAQLSIYSRAVRIMKGREPSAVYLAFLKPGVNFRV